MRNVTLDEQHLVDIAYAIRDKSGIPQGTPVMEISKTPNVTDKDTADTSGGYGNGRKLFDTATIPGASTILVELTIHTESTTYDFLQILPGIVTTEAGFSGATKYGGTKKTTQVLTFENTDTVSFYFKSDSSNCSFFGYYAEVTGLDADGRLITDGVPSTTFRPCDMAAAIAGIVAGGNGEGGASALECIAVTGVNDLSIGYSYDLSSYLDEDFIYLNWIVSSSSSVLDYAQGFIYRANGSTEALPFGNNPLTTTSATSAKARGVFTDGRLELHANSSSYRVQQTGYVIKGSGATLGVFPEGELQITKSGTYDVTDYASVGVDVTETEDALLNGTLRGAYTNDRITYIRASAFYNCKQLTSINLPNVTGNLDTNAFYYCSSMETINLSSLESIVGSNIFYNCSSLEEIELPSLTTIGQYNTGIFSYCYALKKVKLPKLSGSWIPNTMFSYCTALEAVILGGSEMNKLNTATSPFTGATKMKDGTGFVYVPAALIETYQTDSKWASAGVQFRAIEDYPEICS